MPVYEYRCEKCAYEFDAEQKITDKPLNKCPECNGKVSRLISASSFALKGGGWYKDGYASKSPSKSCTTAGCNSCSSAKDEKKDNKKTKNKKDNK